MNLAILDKKLFQEFSTLIYDETAISLNEKKFSLVQNRINKRLKSLKIATFKEYYDYLTHQNNKNEIFNMIDAISTNVTSFFRETVQWEFLKNNIALLQKWHNENGKLRIWSSASSSGEEPYSIAMFMLENYPNIRNSNIKILATDISRNILKKGIKGEYLTKDIDMIPDNYLLNYFVKSSEDKYRIRKEVRDMVVFREFNLTRGNFDIFKNRHFDIIFCRNVMIYFDIETKKILFEHFLKLLLAQRCLFLGHSESMVNDLNRYYKLVVSSIYKKI